MVDVQSLSNTILKRMHDESIIISPMKLQKLLYFVCAKYLQHYDNPLISESFCVWKYGPVLQSVYSEFKSYGSKSITGYARNSNGEAFVIAGYSESGKRILEVIETILDKYGRYNGIELSNITHQEGSGWYKAFIDGRSVVSNEDMKNDKTF